MTGAGHAMAGTGVDAAQAVRLGVARRDTKLERTRQPVTLDLRLVGGTGRTALGSRGPGVRSWLVVLLIHARILGPLRGLGQGRA